jgi:hypothetical protein
MNDARRGRDFERAVMAYLRAAGWLVIRAAGSHGPADLIAVEPVLEDEGRRLPALGNELALIQCKLGGPGRLGPAEWNALYLIAMEYGAVPVVAYRPARGRLALARMIGLKSVTGVRDPAAPCEEWAP